MKRKFILFIVLICCIRSYGNGPVSPAKKNALPDGFKSLISIPTTPVQDQAKTNACWSFATLSFLEAELLRTENKEYNFSEMFIVKHAYQEKADKYVRMHGKTNFGGGGEFHDVLNIIDKYGIVPEEDFLGLVKGEDVHNHLELDQVLKNYIDGILVSSGKHLTDVWKDGYFSILDSYLGDEPVKLKTTQNKLTPIEYASALPLNTSDYITITSFTHHSYFEPFILEVPDNWAWEMVYNIPLSDLELIVDKALMNGFSVAWMADNTEPGFLYESGLAVAPKEIYAPKDESDKKLMGKFTKDELNMIYGVATNLAEEVEVTPQIRQKAFNNYSTTDDHAMHITGLAEASDGSKFYQVKNSWGIRNRFGGYLYVSKPYFKYKTISVLVHKDAIPESIRKKLKL